MFIDTVMRCAAWRPMGHLHERRRGLPVPPHSETPPALCPPGRVPSPHLLPRYGRVNAGLLKQILASVPAGGTKLTKL